MRIRPSDWILLSAVFFLCIFVTSLYGVVTLPLLFDAPHQFFIAERAASGTPPHASQWSAKNELGFLVHAGAVWIGRYLSIPDIYSTRILDLLMVACSAILAIFCSVELSGGRRIAAAGAVLSLLSFRGYLLSAAMGAEPKIPLVFFVFLQIWFAIRNAPFWIALSGMLCFLCWQPTLIVWAGAFVLILFQKEKVRWFAMFFLGTMIPLVLYEMYFYAHGILSEQLHQSYVFPAKFMSGSFQGLSAIYDLALDWGRGSRFTNPSLLFPLVAVAVFFGDDKDGILRAAEHKVVWLYLMICFAGAVAFTIYDHQGYSDLFFFLPYLCIFSGVGIAWLRNRRKFVSAVIIIVYVIVVIRGPSTGLKESPAYTLQEQIALAKEVQKLHQQYGAIYAIRCAHLLAFNHLDNWSKFSSLFRGVPEYLRTLPLTGAEVPWEARPLPPVVLVRDFTIPEIGAVLKQKYQRQIRPDFEKQNIKVWIRRGG